MFSLLRIVIVGGILVGGLGFIIYHLLRFAFGINNPASLAKRDGSKLRQEILPYAQQLVPFTEAEMELLSLDNNITTKRKAAYTLTTGMFNSIFHEPLAAFAQKQYRGKQVSSLLITTSKDEFFYISMKGETQAFHNGQALGIIRSNGDLISPNRKQLLAHLSPEDVLELHPVSVGGREVGRVKNPLIKENVSSRAFQFLEKMDDREQTLFLSLSMLSLVEETLESRR